MAKKKSKPRPPFLGRWHIVSMSVWDESMNEEVQPFIEFDNEEGGGDQESFGFVVRAIGYGGLDFEDDRPDTLAEAMVVLEAGLARWFEEQGQEMM